MSGSSESENPLVSILEHLFRSQEGNTKLLAELCRDVAAIKNAVDLLTGQEKSVILNRLIPLEQRVAALEHPGGPNGTG
jgi:hypothetical protein